MFLFQKFIFIITVLFYFRVDNFFCFFPYTVRIKLLLHFHLDILNVLFSMLDSFNLFEAYCCVCYRVRI